MCGADCFLMLLSVLFPPIGVWVKRGLCSADSLINIALCCLGFLPGLLHAWYIILQNPDPNDYDYAPVADQERAQRQGGNGRTTYYVVAHEERRGPHPQRAQQQGTAYGTVPAQQPSGGQFPGQQSGVVNSFAGTQTAKYVAQAPHPAGAEGGEGSSQQPEGPPPTYADAVKGDHKVQGP